MKIVFNFDAKPLIDGIMGNFPEYSSDTLTCVAFNYARCEYQFVEQHTQVVHKLYRPKLTFSLQTMLLALLAGYYPGVSQYVMRNFQDVGNWDATASQLLIEYAIHGGPR